MKGTINVYVLLAFEMSSLACSEGNSNALASGVMSALPLHIGSPPVFNEKCSRGVFARGGSINMLWGTFGFYSCIVCCAITGKLVHMCFTHAFICRLAVYARNDLGRPPFQLDCFLTHVTCTTVCTKRNANIT